MKYQEWLEGYFAAERYWMQWIRECPAESKQEMVEMLDRIEERRKV